MVLMVPCLLLFAACDSLDDSFKEMNTNPTQADQINPDFKLTNIQVRISGERFENWRTSLIYSSVMIQHFATLPGYWAGDKYGYIGSYSASMWDRYYPNIAKNIEDLLLQTAENPDDVNLNAIARITRVFMYHRLTDLYGDVPYSEAGKGFLEGITHPKYDAQQAIYADMLSELEAAAAALDPSKKTYGTGDLLYSGDVNQWKKFAYSMMLRLGMRLSKVDPGTAQTWVQKAIQGGVMESNADIARVPHDPSGWANGHGSVFLADGSPRISKTFVDMMQSTGDPRLFVYGTTPVAGSAAIGMPNGHDDQTIQTEANWVSCDTGASPCEMDVYMVPNAVIKGQDDPMFFQTYAEVEFMLAEAAVRGWGASDAAGHYEKGVRAAMKYLEAYGSAAAISDEQINTYLEQNPYDPNNALEQINTQYWMATLLNEYEAFANWRRSGYPTLTPVNYPGNVTGGTIPRRMRYREAEAVANPVNYQEAISRQGPDELTTRVWWDN